jgi:hypothetical protein
MSLQFKDEIIQDKHGDLLLPSIYLDTTEKVMDLIIEYLYLKEEYQKLNSIKEVNKIEKIINLLVSGRYIKDSKHYDSSYKK